MPRRHAPTSRRALTLIETIAAVVILGIGVPSVLHTLSRSHRERANPILASRARWLAQEKLEDILADRHSATRGYGWVVTANYPTENPPPGFAGFVRSVAISESGPDLVSAGTGYKTASVQLRWTDSTGTARSLTLATVVTDY